MGGFPIRRSGPRLSLGRDSSDGGPTIAGVTGDPPKQVVPGRRIPIGVAFVPCRLCRAPIDLAYSRTRNHTCVECALASYEHSWN
jgi:hypothetical protein